MKALYPGSFDPFTLGHLDIVERASRLLESVTVLISYNPDKQGNLTIEDKIRLIEEATSHLPNVKVESFHGLTVDYGKKKGYDALLRGIRAASDFEVELEMSQVNNFLAELETIFLMTSPEHSFIRSSRVWELLKLGGDISNLVPTNVAKHLKEYRGGHLQQT